MKKTAYILMCMAICAAASGCSSDTGSTVTETASETASEVSAESQLTSADESADITEEAEKTVSSSAKEDEAVSEETDTGSVAVAYFSATGNTADIAEKIADILGADKYEIIPLEPYTADDLNYNDDSCRANIEMNDESARPAIDGDMTALTEYDTVFIGYPVWWGTAPRIINTFFDSYDMSGKTIYTFCTSGGSGIGQSIDDLTGMYPDITISDGRRFNAGASEDDVREWLDGLDS